MSVGIYVIWEAHLQIAGAVNSPHRRLWLQELRHQRNGVGVAAVVLKRVAAHTSLDETRSLSGVTRGEGTRGAAAAATVAEVGVERQQSIGDGDGVEVVDSREGEMRRRRRRRRSYGKDEGRRRDVGGRKVAEEVGEEGVVGVSVHGAWGMGFGESVGWRVGILMEVGRAGWWRGRWRHLLRMRWPPFFNSDRHTECILPLPSTLHLFERVSQFSLFLSLSLFSFSCSFLSPCYDHPQA